MYSVAFMAVSTAVSLPSSVISAAMPAVAAQEGAGRVQEAAASLGAAFRVLLVASAIITAGVASLGPPLVSLAYGAEFLEAANLIPLLSIGIVASTTAMLFWSFMQGSGRMRIPITASAMAAVVDLGVAFALVGSLGAKGAAIANVCAQYVLFIGIAILSRREFPHFRAGLRVLVAPVAFCVVLGLSCMWLVRTVGYSDAGSAAVALLLGGAVAGAATLGYGSLIGFFRGPDAIWLSASLPAGLGKFLFLVTASRRRPSTAAA
jgi:O-antigen/teichoic acid export membrane protein